MTYKAPVVLGIQPIPLPKGPSEIEPMLSNLGNNTGNLFFSEALFRVIKNAKSARYCFSDEDLDGRDCIVISAANWLNPYEDFGDLAERLEKTKLPIFLIGIGAQSHDSQQVPVLKGGTLAFVRLVSSRSNLISVRGDYSQWVLSKYGINNVLATGCPSLLLNGLSIPIIKNPFF